jgi:hypothetical protein
MENLQTRILLAHVQGATLAYLYGREGFNLLNVKIDDYEEVPFLEIGDTITYEDESYKVVNMSFKMHPKIYDMGNMGINMYSPTAQLPYNCQIAIIVDSI